MLHFVENILSLVYLLLGLILDFFRTSASSLTYSSKDLLQNRMLLVGKENESISPDLLVSNRIRVDKLVLGEVEGPSI